MFASHPPYGDELQTATLLLAVALPVFVRLMHRRRWRFSLKLSLTFLLAFGLACGWLREDIRQLAQGWIGIDWKTIIPAFVLSALIPWGVTYPRNQEPDDGAIDR